MLLDQHALMAIAIGLTAVLAAIAACFAMRGYYLARANNRLLEQLVDQAVAPQADSQPRNFSKDLL